MAEYKPQAIFREIIIEEKNHVSDEDLRRKEMRLISGKIRYLGSM